MTIDDIISIIDLRLANITERIQLAEQEERCTEQLTLSAERNQLLSLEIEIIEQLVKEGT